MRTGQAGSLRCVCEHMFVAQMEPWVQRTGRPPSQSRTRPIATRHCRIHGDWEHGYYSAGNGTYRWRCKRCVADAVTRRHHKIKLTLIADHGGCCAICGYDRCPVSLQFHHVDPRTKSFRIAMSSGKSLARFREEASKCVLVCANCHGEIEAGLIDSPPPRTTYRGSALPSTRSQAD